MAAIAQLNGWMIGLWAAAAVAAETVPVPPPPETPPIFFYKDWELACDNTGTCRAAGYQNEISDSEPVSLLITRGAGPSVAPVLRLQVLSEKSFKPPLILTVGTLETKGLPNDPARAMDAAQAAVLLPALIKAEEANVRAGDMRWALSLAGLNAVLLKMDEVQGRIDTPGALVRRGTKPESGVRLPSPVPLVKAQRLVATRPTDAALGSSIFAKVSSIDLAACNDPDPQLAQVYRLTDTEVLLSLSCGMGAYNGSSLLWVAKDRPPFAPQLLDVDGEFDPSTGTVHSSMKIRGIGDCWSVRTWQFTRQGFILVSDTADGMCRGFAGGAWGLSRHVARVIAP